MDDYVYVRKNARYEQVHFSELIFVKAMRGYMQVVTERQIYYVLNTIEEVEKYLPNGKFCRIHRSYIIALERIASFDMKTVFLKRPKDENEYIPGLSRTTELPIGRSFRHNLFESIAIVPNRVNRFVKKIIKEKEFLLECEVGVME